LAGVMAPTIRDVITERINEQVGSGIATAMARVKRDLSQLQPKTTRAYSVLENVKAIDDGQRWIEGTCSSFRTDRVGDRVNPRGAIVPPHVPLLYQHDIFSPIGTCTEIIPNDTSIRFKAKIAKIPDDDQSAGASEVRTLCDKVWTHLLAETIKGVSIGFVPVAGGSEPIPNGTLFSKYHLAEISVVSVPANIDCNLSVIRSLDDPCAVAVIDAIAELREDNARLRRQSEITKGMDQLWQAEVAELRRRVEAAEAKTMEQLDPELRAKIELLDAIPRYVGTYQQGTTYPRGSMCTYAGAIWHCNEVTNKKPGDGEGNGWALAVKSARNAKSAFDIWRSLGNQGTERDFIASLKGADGRQGPMGPPGRDRT
jgi:hypothetical protein